MCLSQIVTSIVVKYMQAKLNNNPEYPLTGLHSKHFPSLASNYTIVEVTVRDKHTNLLRCSNYGHKKFYKTVACKWVFVSTLVYVHA